MLPKIKIKQSFAAASSTYDSVALLQRNVGERLLKSIEKLGQIGTAVDLGCGTGFLADGLLQHTVCQSDNIIAVDVALPMLHIARNKLKNNQKISYLCADAECLPLQSQAVDLVVSNLAFQWCGNLGQTFGDIKRILRPEGQFYFTTFGQQTLHELKHAWREVDGYNHVNTFVSAGQLKELLHHAGFKQVEMETSTYISSYESVWDLMAELKQLGAHTVLEGCNKRLTSRKAMQSMIAAYQRQNGDGLVPATFEVITVKARAKA